MIDIHSKGTYPADVLSNFAPHAFVFDGVSCASMEGFLQSLKYKNQTKQRAVCALSGGEAKDAGTHKFLWKLTGRVYWQGKAYRRTSQAFSALILRAYQALHAQNETFATALQSTCGTALCHTIGKHRPRRTILTEEEFITCLLTLRGDGKDIHADL